MTRMMKLSDQEFKTTVINMLRALMDKVDNMEEQRKRVDNVSREMDMLRRNQKEILKIKNTNRNKNAFHGLISRLGHG